MAAESVAFWDEIKRILEPLPPERVIPLCEQWIGELKGLPKQRLFGHRVVEVKDVEEMERRLAMVREGRVGSALPPSFWLPMGQLAILLPAAHWQRSFRWGFITGGGQALGVIVLSAVLLAFLGMLENGVPGFIAEPGRAATFFLFMLAPVAFYPYRFRLRAEAAEKAKKKQMKVAALVCAGRDLEALALVGSKEDEDE